MGGDHSTGNTNVEMLQLCRGLPPGRCRGPKIGQRRFFLISRIQRCFRSLRVQCNRGGGKSPSSNKNALAIKSQQGPNALSRAIIKLSTWAWVKFRIALTGPLGRARGRGEEHAPPAHCARRGTGRRAGRTRAIHNTQNISSRPRPSSAGKAPTQKSAPASPS